MAYYSVLMCIVIFGSALLSMAYAQNCNSTGEDYLEFCLIGLVEYVIFFCYSFNTCLPCTAFFVPRRAHFCSTSSQKYSMFSNFWATAMWSSGHTG